MYVDQIVKDVRANPDNWRRYSDNAITRGDITIYQCGNGSKWFFFWFTSIVDIRISGHDSYALTWRDRYRLEEVVRWWMRSVPLSTIMKPS